MAADLDFVLKTESDPENSPFIGSWTRAAHEDAISHSKYWHHIIQENGNRLGYLIGIDLRDDGLGVFLKRIVVVRKAKGIGRKAIQAFVSGLPAPAPTHIWLAVGRDNPRAQRAYGSIGFEENAVTAAVRANLKKAVGVLGEDRVLMFKTLESRSI